MRASTQILGAFALTFLAQSEAVASGITMVRQDRRVHASAFVSDSLTSDSDAQQFVAPDGGPFDTTATADASIPGASSSASASQISALTEHLIEARGAYDAGGQVVEGATAFSSSETNVAFRFIVPEAMTYSLLGFVEAADGGHTTL